MKIHKANSRREGPVTQKKSKRKGAAVQSKFSQRLQLQYVQQIDLVQALEEIDEYAERLKRSPVLENLLRYKNRVRAILRFLVEGVYGVTENTCYDPQGRRRLLMLVESIDQKMEQLTHEFLRQQGSGLELVSRLDEIRGLLLDLLI